MKKSKSGLRCLGGVALDIMTDVWLGFLDISVRVSAMEAKMNEFERGVQAERKRIMEALHRYKAEGLEIVQVGSQPGINTRAVRRFDTAELIERLWEEREEND